MGVEPGGGGVVTLLFTDLVGSTEVLSRLGDDAAEALRRTHFGLLRAAVAEFRGEEVKSLGDGLMVAFASPLDALGAAVRMQENVAGHNQSQPARPLAVRIGLHAGEASRDEDDFFGTPVVVAKRLCDAAGGGQILAGEVVAGLVGTRGGFRFRPAGRFELKGIPERLAAVEVAWGPVGAVSGNPAANPAPAGHQGVGGGGAIPARGRRRRASGNRGTALAGRRQELAVLEGELAQSSAGEFRCVVLTGEPGVGKTRLADELAARHDEGTLVLSARGHPLGAGAAFGLWTEALEPVLAGLSDDEVGEVCGGFLDDLAAISHRVAAVLGSAPTGDPPRLRLLTGLTRLLEGLARRGPVLVLLDDVHHADASSWEALRHMARHLDDARLLVVATARPAELAACEVGPQVLFELDQDGLLTRLEVGALDRHQLRGLVEAVIGTPPPAALVEWLAERSQGNALFAIGLLRALAEEQADLGAPRLRRLPESLAERVGARLRHYREPERAVLELLAVAGRSVTLGELTALTGRNLEELEPLVEELVADRSVTEQERGRDLIYEIQHPLVRDLIYEGIRGARRRVLHRQTGRTLHAAGRLAEAALHFARCADAGDPEAVGVLLAALDQAEHRESYREALTLLAELVELLPPDDERWLAVGEAMYWRAEWLVDHRADSHTAVAVRALRTIDRLLDGVPDAARRAAVKLRLANFLAWGTGELAEAQVTCAAARALFGEAGDHRGSLLAERELAWIAGLSGDLAGMEREAARITEAAEAAGDRFLLMQALHAVAFSAGFRGDFAAAREALTRSGNIAREDGKVYRLTMTLATQANFAAWEGRTDECRGLYEEAKTLNPAYRDTILVELETIALWLAGDFPAALAAAREAVARMPTGVALRRTIGFIGGALAAAELGETAEAERFLERVHQSLGGRDWSVYTQWARHAEALLAWQAGRVGQAMAALAVAADRLLSMEGRAWVTPTLVDLAEAAAEVGDAATARRAAGDLAEIAAFVDRPLHHGLAALAASWAALAEGDAQGAAAAGRDSVERLAGAGWRAHLGRAQHVVGRAAADLDRAEAVRALEAAAATFAACGAAWRRSRTLEVLGRLGSSGKRAVAAALGPGSLSRRELDVARLAAKGMSSREIAEALFVGVRTVESHLGRVYAKLGVESRLDLVRRAAEVLPGFPVQGGE